METDVSLRRQGAFGQDVDYAVLTKLDGGNPKPDGDKRYSPAQCIGCEKHPQSATPIQTTSRLLCGAPEPHDENADALLSKAAD